MASRTDRSEAIFPYSTFPKVWRPMCPLCEKMPQGWFDTQDRYGYRVQIGFCRCGLGWLTEQMVRAGYEALYAGPYRELVWGVDHRSPFDAVAEQTVREKDQFHYGKLIAQVVARCALRATDLLDAGGSCGGVVKQWPAGTYDRLTVLDPASQELPTDGSRLLRGYLEDPIAGGPYDGILCARTIDHLTDPLKAFRHMRAACPTGWLLLDFTDLATLARSRRSYPLSVELKIDHPLYWTLNAVKTCLDVTGWDVRWTAAVLAPKTRTEHVFCVAR